jgi:violaxanthin de-epoxidase
MKTNPRDASAPFFKDAKIAMASMFIFSATALTPVFGNVGGNFVASAADTVAVGKCLLSNCQKELAQCVLNPKCLANVVCLNTCNGRADEAECQIKCGDIFENDVVGKFNTCAVSQKKCVPQKQDEGDYPMPASAAQVKKFDTKFWNSGDGRWYITAGLNKIFDIFDCQVHFFDSPSPGKFFAKLNWRVTEPDGEFFTKDAVQRFVQDPKNPAHLINHDNDYLHYKDDWYIIDYEPDDFALVYYKGSNDAWDGYGGAFLYTKESALRPELVPRLEAAVESMQTKYKWSDFTVTDNTCKEQKESATVLREKYASRLLITEEKQLQEQLTAVRGNAINTIMKDEKEAEKSILFLETQFATFQKEIIKDFESAEKEISRDASGFEKALESDVDSIERALKIKR